MIHKNGSLRAFIATTIGIIIVIIIILYSKKNGNDQSFMSYGPSDQTTSDSSSTIDIEDIEENIKDKKTDNLHDEENKKTDDLYDEENITKERDKIEESTEEINIDKNKKNEQEKDNTLDNMKLTIYDKFFIQSVNNILNVSKNTSFTKIILFSNYIMYRIDKKTLSNIKIRRYSEENKLEVMKIDKELVERLFKMIKEVEKVLFRSCINTQNFIQDIVKSYESFNKTNIKSLPLNRSYLIIDNQNVIETIMEKYKFLLEKDVQKEIFVKNLEMCCKQNISAFEYTFSAFIEFFISLIYIDQQTK